MVFAHKLNCVLSERSELIWMRQTQLACVVVCLSMSYDDYANPVSHDLCSVDMVFACCIETCWRIRPQCVSFGPHLERHAKRSANPIRITRSIRNNGPIKLYGFIGCSNQIICRISCLLFIKKIKTVSTSFSMFIIGMPLLCPIGRSKRFTHFCIDREYFTSIAHEFLLSHFSEH